jgi:hypothetical protein
MCSSSTVGAASADERNQLAFGDIVVIGGGCYGSYYVRQLARAASAGAMTWTRLLVVDRDPECAFIREGVVEAPVHRCPLPVVVQAEWGEFLDGWLGTVGEGDMLVPSPLMPNLLFAALSRMLRSALPQRIVEQRPLSAVVGTPWERSATDGAHYISHATWTCPVNCIEPALCPHTRGPRDWSLPETIRRWTGSQRARGEPLAGPFTFHCVHRAYGVGMIDAVAVTRASAAIAAEAARGPVRAVIATASHCHGVAAVLAVDTDPHFGVS